MNPFYFGSSANPLFGVYHPPRARRSRDSGVVLCYPFGQEYMRAHRAFRQLAILLTKTGYPVLRFDYYGTGDSAGESDAGTLDQWLADVAAAVDELKDTAAVRKICLVGLRLGAALAAAVATRRRDVEVIVLWDPVVDGARYVSELLGAPGTRFANGHKGGRVSPTSTVGVLGFPLTPELRAGIERIDLTASRYPKAIRTLLVVSDERDDYIRLHDHLTREGVTARFERFPSSGNWNEVDNFGSVLLPHAVIQGIVTCLAQERT